MIAELTARLADLAALNQTTTYGQLARDLGLTGPETIARLTDALENLMEADAAQNSPFRAALLSARTSSLPAQGFFQKAAELGRDTGGDPDAFVTAERTALFSIHSGTYTPQGVRGV
jgi:hypothetical protein